MKPLLWRAARGGVTSRCLAVLLILISFAACRANSTAPATATVYFVLDAPLCSSIIPVQFTVDNIAVGTDTFRVRVARERPTSAAFTANAGTHMLGATVTGGPITGYTWPNVLVTLAAGAVKLDSLSFYCS